MQKRATDVSDPAVTAQRRDEALDWLRDHATEHTRNGMTRYGITRYGIPNDDALGS